MFSSSSRGVLIYMLSASIFTQASSLLYNELRTLNVSCYPRDSCHLRHQKWTPDDAGETNTCECDATCHRRGTCCIDSPYADPRPSTRSEVCDGERLIGVGRYYYFNHTGSKSFFQVTKCDRSWNGPIRVKELCEIKEPVEGVDFMIAIPVTNTHSGLSYKNYFCALCNYDIEGSVLWDVGIFREGDSDTLISDRFSVQGSEEPADSSDYTTDDTCDGRNTLALVFNEEKRFYGYWDNCSNDSPRFVWVEVVLSIPKEIVPYVKGCMSDLISKCAPDWSGIRDGLKCAGYLGIIKGPGIPNVYGIPQRKYFRNVHCAICNNVTNFEGYSCEPFWPGKAIVTPTYPTSFTVLFGHLLSDNGCLGENERFVKGIGCRAVLCANPRHKVENGRCVVK